MVTSLTDLWKALAKECLVKFEKNLQANIVN